MVAVYLQANKEPVSPARAEHDPERTADTTGTLDAIPEYQKTDHQSVVEEAAPAGLG